MLCLTGRLCSIFFFLVQFRIFGNFEVTKNLINFLRLFLVSITSFLFLFICPGWLNDHSVGCIFQSFTGFETKFENFDNFWITFFHNFWFFLLGNFYWILIKNLFAFLPYFLFLPCFWLFCNDLVIFVYQIWRNDRVIRVFLWIHHFCQ